MVGELKIFLVDYPIGLRFGLMIEAVVKSLLFAGYSMTDSWSSKEIWMQMCFKREAGSKLSASKSQTRVGGNEAHLDFTTKTKN
ncbi:hypothetical protein PSHT_08504 [Puccinia striiformis]|uniref:Uncharacterized protein n=1 Tax=Puccinia striiformis TaxID=27350 RepID=A0A2S4VP27_9BASI|nr:hypothetical protein PSHT_08504 [Puccinia striiformis]